MTVPDFTIKVAEKEYYIEQIAVRKLNHFYFKKHWAVGMYNIKTSTIRIGTLRKEYHPKFEEQMPYIISHEVLHHVLNYFINTEACDGLDNLKPWNNIKYRF